MLCPPSGPHPRCKLTFFMCYYKGALFPIEGLFHSNEQHRGVYGSGESGIVASHYVACKYDISRKKVFLRDVCVKQLVIKRANLGQNTELI